ncbi:unnamed protein product [Candidula unifasciata]|uniref:Receptor-binding cancer antigen expressed on SiSo cells n=1 Tax=Candidula unifasciata TaxID=100452 RepID=A0A8S3Z4Q0_9EUPU|nr:unnamed protein product [Candidula unifasciata]
MESWDMWDLQSQSVPGYKPSQAAVHPSQQFAQANSQGHKGEVQMNGFSQQKHPQGYNGNKVDTQNVQMDPEINFFEDMTPQVKRQPKILIRKKDSSQPSGGSLSNRLAVLSDVPFSNSELEAWEEQANAWDTEVASDDLIWQAEEAIKETRRKERMERHMEQQKKKQKKDEMRGMKSGSLLATKIS